MLQYDTGKDIFENWIVSQTEFSPSCLGKTEAIMATGNGYLGVRAAEEESYIGQKRDSFIAGTFNRFSEKEVSELPNLPDATGIEFTFDGNRFSLEQGKIISFNKSLNLKTALLTRGIVWQSPAGKKISLDFQRFVSMERLNVMASRIVISCAEPVAVTLRSGINGQVTNTGTQHLNEEDMRFFDKKYLQYNSSTTQSQILVSANTTHQISCEAESSMFMDRRCIEQCFSFTLNGSATIDKLSAFYTSIDRELAGKSHADVKAHALAEFKTAAALGFDKLLREHTEAWNKKVWSACPITIDSSRAFDQLAIRFAMYHIAAMTPAHDNRCGIAAKGLSGEGYKGHSFWDTELFLLPFFIYTNPAQARRLLEYRYLGLAGARKKALENGFAGAMYPWETAWPTDGEVTPVWGAVDIVTGKQTKIWSGFIEIHITGDIALGVQQYYTATGDEDFMNRYGYEMLFDTANFWASRYEWNEAKKRYEINDVVGPDEYKEHVNNNAFTNHISAHNLRLAISFAQKLQAGNHTLFAELNEKLGVEKALPVWQERLEKIYLPEPNEALLVPQDDKYLQSKVIDLEPYKNAGYVGALFNDYNLEQVCNIQVSKQADIMMLFYQLESLFSHEVKIANYNYYEPKTMHDSSLSLSTHSILANDLGEHEKAYSLFGRAAEIDLGRQMKSSDHGIHSASFGGLWQCVVMGFAGMRVTNGHLRFQPKLPAEWKSLSFDIFWHEKRLDICVTKDSLTISSTSAAETEAEINGNTYKFSTGLTVSLEQERA